MTTVLVAEPNAEVRDIISSKLGQDGYEVRSAANGLSALDEITSGEIDVAILDVTMPGASGLEVCRKVRANRTEADLPVIMVTSRAADTSAGYTAGADDVIVTPFPGQQLAHRMALLLRCRMAGALSAALPAAA